jgi:hypothetical protein
VKRNVVFIHRLAKPNRILGSAYMRGDQLVEMIRPHLDETYALRVLPFHAGILPGLAMNALAHAIPKNSIIIFIKTASKGLTQRYLEPLRRRGAVIGLDSVDTPISEIDFDLFDFHIAASISGRRALQERLEFAGRRERPVELLLHHADPRLRIDGMRMHDHFRCGYVGMPENLFVPSDLRSQVDTIYVKHPSDFGSAIPLIRQFSLHYAVRPNQQETDSHVRAFKPFTKGFVAASCGANVLVSRHTDDAVELLGDDYPYLVDDRNGQSIGDTLQRAREDFGRKAWLDGLQRMRTLDAAVSNVALAERMRQILDRVSDIRRE